MSDEGLHPRRGNWYLLTGILIGISLGLLYAWLISPVKYVDNPPAALRTDFKDQYRLLIAYAYQQTGNLARAQARLALLGDADAAQILLDQAQRLLAAGDPDHSAGLLTSLAEALQQVPAGGVSQSPAMTPAVVQQPGGGLTPSSTPGGLAPSRPSLPPSPTPGAPFIAVKQENVCDANLPRGLLQVEVHDAAGQAVPGMELILTWSGGETHFFTGFKLNQDIGYADFSMTPGIAYTLQMAYGDEPVTGLIAPSCTTAEGKIFIGGISVIFQQP